jgi:hypothetical protein
MVDEDAPRRFKLLGVRAVKITENRLMILRGRTRLTFEAPEAAAAWTSSPVSIGHRTERRWPWPNF